MLTRLLSYRIVFLSLSTPAPCHIAAPIPRSAPALAIARAFVCVSVRPLPPPRLATSQRPYLALLPHLPSLARPCRFGSPPLPSAPRHAAAPIPRSAPALAIACACVPLRPSPPPNAERHALRFPSRQFHLAVASRRTNQPHQSAAPIRARDLIGCGSAAAPPRRPSAAAPVRAKNRCPGRCHPP